MDIGRNRNMMKKVDKYILGTLMVFGKKLNMIQMVTLGMKKIVLDKYIKEKNEKE